MPPTLPMKAMKKSLRTRKNSLATSQQMVVDPSQPSLRATAITHPTKVPPALEEIAPWAALVDIPLDVEEEVFWV